MAACWGQWLLLSPQHWPRLDSNSHTCCHAQACLRSSFPEWLVWQGQAQSLMQRTRSLRPGLPRRWLHSLELKTQESSQGHDGALKPSLAMLTSHIQAPVRVSAALFLIQLSSPATASGMAAEDGPSAWASASHMGDPDAAAETPGFGLCHCKYLEK